MGAGRTGGDTLNGAELARNLLQFEHGGHDLELGEHQDEQRLANVLARSQVPRHQRLSRVLEGKSCAGRKKARSRLELNERAANPCSMWHFGALVLSRAKKR